VISVQPILDNFSLERPTARPDLSERAYLLTVPSQATVKSLSGERPVDGGAAQVRGRHDLFHRLLGLLERFHPRRIDFRRTARLTSLGGQPLLIATNAVELAVLNQGAFELGRALRPYADSC